MALLVARHGTYSTLLFESMNHKYLYISYNAYNINRRYLEISEFFTLTSRKKKTKGKPTDHYRQKLPGPPKIKKKAKR